ncbi:titin-like isoform X4 [Carassius gibelio]|uniref:titin-like isoform X4 n=1 Tax=Carassius gibelio TaxID=101364 RepID=UPI0022775CC4|nr:titin-like isoform X4 [Carassius gibelio]
MERFKIFLLTVAVCVLVTSQESTTDPPVPQIQSEWSEAFHGEKVSLKCVIQDSNSWNYTWFKGLNEIVSNDETNIQGNTLTLSVQSGHGGVYECQAELQDRNVTTAKSPPHSLRVHELPKPELSIVSQWKTFYPTEKLTLKCSIKEDSNKWDYEWFRNGALLSQDKDISFSGNTLSISSVNVVHAGQYTCRGKHQTRKPVTTGKTEALQLNVHDTTPKPTITKNQWFEPFYSKERVQLNCNMPGVGWEYHWYKGSNRLTTSPEFTIDSVSVTDTGNYQCKAQRGDFSVDSETLQVRVQDPPKPQIQSEWTEAFHGEKVSLQCVIQDSESWKYTWLRDQNKIVSSDVTNIKGNTLTLSVQSDHGGVYECQAELQDRNVMTGKSPPHSLTVHGPQPTIVLKQDPSYPEIYTGEQVRLNCSIQEKTSKWQYIWEKDSRQVNTDPSNPVYTIQSASLSENGEYTCQVRRGEKTSSKSRKLTVKDPPKPQIQSEWTEAFHGEKVSLQCVIQDSESWKYTWFRDQNKMVSKDGTIIMIGNTLTLSVQSDHGGVYECQAELQDRNVMTTKSPAHSLRVHGPQPTIVLKQDPSYPEIYTGEQVRLICSIQEKTSKWQYIWEKDSRQVNTDPSNPVYTIQSASLPQNGEYSCQVRRGEKTSSKSRKLTVKEPPKPELSIMSQWKTFYPTEKLTLKCSIKEDSDKWDYEWFRNGAPLSQDKDISFSGNKLSISSVNVVHAGQYTCRGKHQTRKPVTTGKTEALQLHVHDITPKADISKHQWFEFFYTEERVHLNCTMSGVGWQYQWYKGSSPLIKNAELAFSSVSHTHIGDYHCKAQRGDFSVNSETLQVQVQARPAVSLSLETELGDIMTGDMTLRCNVSDGRQWNYTWFMNGQQLNETSDLLKRKGNEETIKSEFKCKGINTERPLYSALSDGFIANNIIFKRKILLAISLCLVCCIVILIIGCIVLKITRKPEVKETAQDDLFFSMTDSKIQAASPMKEYMDNSPTELEECQEKEELITDRTSAVQEDAVIKDEETPASEANGLISFKGL